MFKRIDRLFTFMYSQYTPASRTAGIAQQCSGIRFTSMWKAVFTLGALFGGYDNCVDSDGSCLPPDHQLADGDGQ